MSNPALAAMDLNAQISYANSVAAASILPQEYRNRPADVLVAMGLGQSMGLSPMESLYRIYVVKGKPTAAGELIAANVRKAGHKLWCDKDEQHMSVTAHIVRSDMPDHPVSVTRDMAWAESMGLAGKENYRKQPMTMLMWRAITAAAREACPEALYGVVYTPDEMYDMDATSVTPEYTVQPAPQPAPRQTGPVDRLAPLRSRIGAYAAALYPGMDPKTAKKEASHNLCVYAEVANMQDLTDEQVVTLAELMDATTGADGSGPVEAPFDAEVADNG